MLGLAVGLSACGDPEPESAAAANGNAPAYQAVLLFQRGEATQALNKLDSLIAARPTHAEAMLMAGAMRERMGQNAAAIQQYRRAVSVLRERVASPAEHLLPQELNLAFALFVAGETNEALEIVQEEKAGSTDPNVIAICEFIRSEDRSAALDMLAPTRDS